MTHRANIAPGEGCPTPRGQDKVLATSVIMLMPPCSPSSPCSLCPLESQDTHSLPSCTHSLVTWGIAALCSLAKVCTLSSVES